MKNPAPYRRPYRDTQPDYLFPPYASTVKRAPAQPLVVLPHTLSELTAPVFGYGDIKPTDSDLRSGRRMPPGATTTASTSTMRRSIPTSPAPAASSPMPRAATAS
jgi:hypothetical protein